MNDNNPKWINIIVVIILFALGIVLTTIQVSANTQVKDIKDDIKICVSTDEKHDEKISEHDVILENIITRLRNIEENQKKVITSVDSLKEIILRWRE
jgi:hypothetical protein